MSYIKSLRKEITEMWLLVHSQLTKSFTALVHFDKDLAREVILIDERVKSSEILIDSECETYISLQAVRSVNIQYIMAVLKINMQLERIGDISKDIAHQVLSTPTQFSEKMLKDTKVVEMYQKAIKIVELTYDAFEKEDVSIAQLVLDRADIFEDISSQTNSCLKDYAIEFPNDIGKVLSVFSIIKNLETIVDQTKMLADEIIFYNGSIVGDNAAPTI